MSRGMSLRRLLGALCVASTSALAAEADSPSANLGWLADLSGSCWRGSDAEGRTTDRQCYSLQFERFLRGSIEVHAGSATGKSAYRGDSFFAWDAAAGRLRYAYWASAGHFGTAEAYYEGERLVFPPADEGEGGEPAVRSVWERLDADSFLVVRERRDGEGWRELMRATYRREPEPAAGDEVLAPLAWLADSCWTGTFADGVTKDFVCYEWMLGGKFLRSRHRVIGGAGPYSGETILARDPASGALEFTYFNSPGGIIRGDIEPAADGLRFPSERVEMGGESFELRSVWRRDGADRYEAVSEKLVDGEWQPFMRIAFVRSGPASGWSEGE